MSQAFRKDGVWYWYDWTIEKPHNTVNFETSNEMTRREHGGILEEIHKWK